MDVRRTSVELEDANLASDKSKFDVKNVSWNCVVSCGVFIGCDKFWQPRELVDALAKLLKGTFNFVVSDRPRGTTRLPLDRFSRNLVFDNSWKSF